MSEWGWHGIKIMLSSSDSQLKAAVRSTVMQTRQSLPFIGMNVGEIILGWHQYPYTCKMYLNVLWSKRVADSSYAIMHCSFKHTYIGENVFSSTQDIFLNKLFWYICGICSINETCCIFKMISDSKLYKLCSKITAPVIRIDRSMERWIASGNSIALYFPQLVTRA